MVALAGERQAHAAFAGGLHGGAQRVHADQRADAVVAVDQAQRGGGAVHADAGLAVDAADLQALAI